MFAALEQRAIVSMSAMERQPRRANGYFGAYLDMAKAVCADPSSARLLTTRGVVAQLMRDEGGALDACVDCRRVLFS